MANLECVRVYSRLRETYSSTIAYDKDTGTGTDEGKFGYLLPNLSVANVQFYLRIYKFTTTKGGSYYFIVNLPGTLTTYTPSSILSTSCTFRVGVESTKDAFSSYYWGTTDAGATFSMKPSTSSGITGKALVNIPSAGTWYVGVWMYVPQQYRSSVWGAQWTGLTGQTMEFTALANFSSCTSTPTEGSGFTVTINCLESVPTWYYSIYNSGSNIYTSSRFTSITSSSITIPSSWFSGEETISATITIHTVISGKGHTGIGSNSITFYSSAAFAPDIEDEAFSSVVPVNTGTLNDYFATVSQVRATIDTSYITCQSGSTLSSVSVALNGTAMSASGYVFTSGTIPSAGTNTLTLTATDSAGRSSTKDYTITVQPYTKPSLTNVGVYRCDSSGTASKTGTYFRATATQQYVSATAEGVSNAGVTHVYLSANGGTYTELANLPSATETEYSGLTASNTYSVRLVITDSIGGSSDGIVIDLSYEEWMFCCTSDGGGAAIGMGASTDNALEIPGDWVLKSASGGQSAEFGASILKLVSGAHYGTSAPSGTGENGEVYFQLGSSSSGWVYAVPYIYISS